MASTIAFAPHQSSPLARTTSPFKDPRAPPSTPRDTAKIWDEYERRAVENARRRETSCTTSSSSLQGSPHRISNGTVMDIIRSYDPHSSPRLLQGSPTLGSDPAFPTTVAICKTCKEPITSASGICATCKKTIVFARSSEDGPHHYHHQPHPPPSLLLRPTAPEQPSTDDAPQPKKSTSAPPSPKRKSLAPPVRLSSPHPPDPLRPRKSSLTDPNDPFLRLQTARPRHTLPPLSAAALGPISAPAPASASASASATVAATPTTPPPTASTPHSRSASVSTPTSALHPRHPSATPSELSALSPYSSPTTTTTDGSTTATTTTTARSSAALMGGGGGAQRSHHRASASASLALQLTTVSAWDDWDSGEEGEGGEGGEKVGLVGYWRGRRWRGSFGGQQQQQGQPQGQGERKRGSGRGRFVRVISCGCRDE